MSQLHPNDERVPALCIWSRPLVRVPLMGHLRENKFIQPRSQFFKLSTIAASSRPNAMPPKMPKLARFIGAPHDLTKSGALLFGLGPYNSRFGMFI